MADIVALAAYRSAHDRIRDKRAGRGALAAGPAALLPFTGVRREPIAAKPPPRPDRDARERRARAVPTNDP